MSDIEIYFLTKLPHSPDYWVNYEINGYEKLSIASSGDSGNGNGISCELW